MIASGDKNIEFANCEKRVVYVSRRLAGLQFVHDDLFSKTAYITVARREVIMVSLYDRA